MAGKNDLTGQRFSHLVVLNKTAKVDNRYTVWHCQCDCGNVIDVNTKKLKRGTVISCGCIKKSSACYGNKAEDITGQQFGDLVALQRVESKNGKTKWLCKCVCGKEVIVNTHELKAGKTKSCGCRKYQKGKNIKDITNQRFGRLVALYPTDKRDYKSSVYWHCRCDCGKELDITHDSLVYGNYKSCGCLKDEHTQNIHQYLHIMDGTCVEWLAHRKSRNDNTSGFRGVYKVKNGYKVMIGFKGKKYYVGKYKSFDEAVKERMRVEEIIHEGFIEAYYQWNEKASQDEEWAKQNPLIYEVVKENGTFRIITNMK